MPGSSSADPNRVPQEEELSSLRSTALQMQALIDRLTEQAAVAVAAYDAIRNQYEVQSCALVKLESDVHLAKDLADSLTKLASSLDPEILRLRGLLHPIRCYPDDILQMVFEECVMGSVEMFTGATQLSHVCQRWRNLALCTKRIWTRISFRLNVSGMFRWSRVEAFLHHVKGFPSHITIDIDLYEMDTQAAVVPIDRIFEVLVCRAPTLSSIHFFISEGDPCVILDSIQNFPKGRVDHFSITAYSSNPHSPQLGTFLSKFASFRRLEVHGGNFGHSISPNLAAVLANLEEMELVTVGELPATEILELAPEIQILRMEYCSTLPYAVNTTEECIMPHLWSLHASSEAFPWGKIQCPHLTKLTLDGPPESNETFWVFLSSAFSITDISVGGFNAQELVRFSQSLPQLKCLHLRMVNRNETLKVFISWHDFGLKVPPFPSLLHLGIHISDTCVDTKTLEGLEKAGVYQEDIQKAQWTLGLDLL
jgi:hypothetical protein